MNVPLPIPAYNTFELDLPVWFASKTKNYGNPKKSVWFSLANPTTTARNISNRKHEHSIDIRRKAIGKPVLHENEWDRATRENLTLEHLSPLDQERVEKVQAHAGRTFANYPVLSRGRPEVLPSNVQFMRHHKDHTQEQKYGTRYLTKVSEVKVGKPIMYGDVPESPSSSRATSIATSRTGSSHTPSRLSALASALRSSPPSHQSFEQEAEEEGSDTSSERTRSSTGNAFRPDRHARRPPSSKSSSSSSGPSRPSVSRGKPPLKRPELTQAQITAIQKRADKQAKQQEKRKAQEDAREAKKKARDDAREAKKKARDVLSEASTTASSVGDHPARPKGKTKWAKPTSSQGDVVLTKKARGRTPKYATKEEAYLAKLEQNKIGKQKRAEAKKKAEEEANK